MSESSFPQKTADLDAKVRKPLAMVLRAAELLQEENTTSTQATLLSLLLQAAQTAVKGIDESLLESSGNRTEPIARSGKTRKLDPFTLSILVCDHNRTMLQDTRDLLEESGCRVFTAVDGREALDVYRTRPVSLILLDLNMPIMDGFTACASIRADERRSGTYVPILALAPSQERRLAEEAIRGGFDGCLSHPLSRGDLFQALRLFLEP